MSDVTFGVKVPEELKDQINDIMKSSGLVGREFMQQLVDLYMMETNKEQMPEMSEEIKELQLITHRINEIYINLGSRFQTIINMNEKEKSSIELEVQEKLNNYSEEIKNYIENLNEQKKVTLEIEEKYKAILKENEELKKEIQKLSDHNENYNQLNKEYRNKITKLEEEVEKFKEYKKENQNLSATNSDLQDKNDTLASELWFCKREIEKLNDQFNKKKKEFEKNLEYINEQHNLEKQTIKLELQVQHQRDIELLNQKIVTIQEEYNNKLKDVILQINKQDNSN